MRAAYRHQLKFKITVVVIMSFLVFSVSLGALSMFYNYQVTETEVEEKLINLVSSHARKLDLEFNEKRIISEMVENYLRATFDYDALKTDDAYMDRYIEEVKPYIKEIAIQNSSSWIMFNPDLVEKQAYNIWYYDINANNQPILMDTLPKEFFDETDGKEWFYVPKNEKKPYWTNPYPSQVLDEENIYWITYSIPVYMEGQFIAIVGFDFNYSHFVKEFSSLTIYETGYGVLMNDRNELLIHPDFDEIVDIEAVDNGSLRWLADEVNNNETGIIEYEWTSGLKKVLAYDHLINGWSVAITAEKEIVFDAINKQLQQTIGITGVGLILAIFIIYQLMEGMTRRLGEVAKGVSTIGRGNYDIQIKQELIDDNSEIGVVSRAVEEMRKRQKLSFKELQNYSETLEELVEKRTEDLEETNEALETSLEDLRVAQKDILTSEKVQAVNRFYFELAHRMNTPLGNVKMSLSFIERLIYSIESSLEEETRMALSEELEKIQNSLQISWDGINTSSVIISSLQELAKDIKNTKTGMIDLSSFIKETFFKFKHQYVFNGTINLVVIEKEETRIETFPTLLIDALTNLFKYTYLYSKYNDETLIVTVHILNRSDEVIIRYTDTQVLIFEEMHERIFEPFSMSTFGNGASGMEMHILYNIVQIGLKGTIECLENEKGLMYYEIHIPKIAQKE